MLSAIRAFAKSPAAAVLIGLLILSFGIFQIRDVVHGKISNAVVTAGSREINAPEFKLMFGNALREVEQQQGQPVTVQEAVAAGYETRVLDEVATVEAFNAFLTKMGISPAPSLIGDALAKQPAFFNKLTGKFDKASFNEVLEHNNLTPAIYMAGLHDQLAQSELETGMAAGLRAPKTYGALIAGYEMEARDLSFFIIDPSKVPQLDPPSDPVLQAFLNQNAAALKRPEMRQLSIVRFSAKALAPSMPVDPAALQKLYDFRKDTASQPEQRSLVDIPVKDAATGASVAAKLKAGQDPAAVAKAIGAQPIVYNAVPKGAIADAKIADAAFAMKAGEISGPVQGVFGLGVIKLGEIKPAHAATLEEMRPQLEAQARSDAAAKKVYDQVQKYQDAHASGANLADSARTAGTTPASLGPITAQGADATGQPVAGISPKLLRDAFNLPQGGESDMVSEASGEYYAIRVEKILPPSVPSLDEIRPKLVRAYMITEMNKRLAAKADELMARVRKGESLESAAAGIGATVGHAPAISRGAINQNRAIGQEMAGRIFAAKKGEVISGPTAQVSVMVVRIDSIKPPAPQQAAMVIAQQNDEFSGQLFQDVGQMFRQAARAQIKPVTDIDRARQALGVSPDSLPKAPGKAGGAPAQ